MFKSLYLILKVILNFIRIVNISRDKLAIFRWLGWIMC